MPKKNRSNPKSVTQRLLDGKRVVQLSASADELEKTRDKLPQFDPVDLRSLVAAAKKQTGTQTAEEKIINELGNRIKEQTEELLRSLACDPAELKWQTAFMRLARIHHGLGMLAYAPKRTNSNARTWTWEHDFRLLTVMRDLKAEGIEGAAAFVKIAKDPKLREQFPYATRSEIRGKDQFAKSLSERWRKLLSRKDPLGEAILGDQPLDAGETEFLLWFLDLQETLPAVAKNKNT